MADFSKETAVVVDIYVLFDEKKEKLSAYNKSMSKSKYMSHV